MLAPLVSQNRQVPDCPNAKDQLRCDAGGRGLGCVCVPVCMYLGASSGCPSPRADMQWTWPHPWPGAARQRIPREGAKEGTGGAIAAVASAGSAPPATPFPVRCQAWRRCRPEPGLHQRGAGVSQELPQSRGFALGLGPVQPLEQGVTAGGGLSRRWEIPHLQAGACRSHSPG